MPPLSRIRIALLLAFAVSASSQAIAESPAAATTGPSPWQGGRVPTENVDYIRIPQASPMAQSPGRIEVVEVFGYTCIHCANLQPLINAWKPELGEDVDFHYMPADFGGYWTPYALAFHAAELLGVLDDSHDALFEAVHRERVLPAHPQATADIIDWHVERGVDRDAFAGAMASFGVRTRIGSSREQIKRWGVGYTPTLVIAGKYRIEPSRDGGFARMLHTADWLIEQERDDMRAATTGPASASD